MIKVNRLLTLGVLILIPNIGYSAVDDTNEYSAICNSCSPKDMNLLAASMTTQYVSPNDSKHNITKILHIIDMDRSTVTSYSMAKQMIYLPYLNPPTYDYVPRYYPINTSSEFNEKAVSLFNKYRQLSQEAASITIPTEVMGGSWEWVGCSYCENDIEDYLNRTGNFKTTTMEVKNILRWINVISGDINGPYTIPLADGGKIVIEIQLINGADDAEKTVRIKIIEVIDKMNNTVPPTRSQSEAIGLKGEWNHYYQEMDRFLWKYGLHMVNVPGGSVVIRDCRPPGQTSPETLPPCEGGQ